MLKACLLHPYDSSWFSGVSSVSILTYLALQVSSRSFILKPYHVQQGNYGDVEADSLLRHSSAPVACAIADSFACAMGDSFACAMGDR
jgi:hypothetical protein